METWKSVLNSDPIDWLLEEDNPSVRYFALTELLDKPFSDNDIKAAKNNIYKYGIFPKIKEKILTVNVYI